MNHLTVQIIKKSCAFVLHIQEPTETLRELSMFFLDRNIIIDNLNMHRYQNGGATLIIHCQIERDRIARTVLLPEELPGIVELDWFHNKVHQFY